MNFPLVLWALLWQRVLRSRPCQRGILGLDFTHDLALQALCLWYEAVKDPHAYFSARPEQNALSIILHKLGMTEWIGYDFVAEGAAKITPTSVYLLDRRVSRKGKGSRKKRVTEEAQKDPIPHNFDHTQARHLDQHGRSTLSAQRV